VVYAISAPAFVAVCGLEFIRLSRLRNRVAFARNLDSAFVVLSMKRSLCMLIISRRTGLSVGVASLAAAVLLPSLVSAAEREKTNTVMTVGEMCGGCVKKITKRFDGIEGIARVQCSIEKQTVTLIPDKGVRLSPKGVWEIMESIGKKPNKMVCPNGTFTSKPKA
jgi:mercuric ion binding protein